MSTPAVLSLSLFLATLTLSLRAALTRDFLQLTAFLSKDPSLGRLCIVPDWDRVGVSLDREPARTSHRDSHDDLPGWKPIFAATEPKELWRPARTPRLGYSFSRDDEAIELDLPLWPVYLLSILYPARAAGERKAIAAEPARTARRADPDSIRTVVA